MELFQSFIARLGPCLARFFSSPPAPSLVISQNESYSRLPGFPPLFFLFFRRQGASSGHPLLLLTKLSHGAQNIWLPAHVVFFRRFLSRFSPFLLSAAFFFARFFSLVYPAIPEALTSPSHRSTRTSANSLIPSSRNAPMRRRRLPPVLGRALSRRNDS